MTTLYGLSFLIERSRPDKSKAVPKDEMCIGTGNKKILIIWNNQ